MEPSKRDRSRNWLRRLMKLLPFDFRWDYGEDIEEVFEEQYRERKAKEGKMGIARLWLETAAGILRTAPREHWDMLRKDIRFSHRMMAKNPGFTVVALLTLALGIGANTAIFSMVNGVLLRPLPYGEGERIVVLDQQAPLAKIDSMPFSVKDIEDYRAQTRTLEEVVEFHSMEFTLVNGGRAERVATGVVSANFFDVLGVTPLLGRTFLPGEDAHGADPILVLTYEYWQGKHGGDPDIIGKAFQMNGQMHTVVGVLPPVPQYPVEREIYMPTSHCPARSSERFIENRQARMMSVFGRVKKGFGLEQVASDLSVISNRLGEEYPEDYPVVGGYSIRAGMLKEELTNEARPTLIILLIATGLVLLIACANVANLTLARVMRRERELALRSVLGADRFRIFRQLLTESTMLAVAGGLLGIGLAYATLDSLVAFASRFTPRAFEVGLDGPVLIFNLALSLGVGIVFGIIPAWSPRRTPASSLHEASSRSTSGSERARMRTVLVVSQVAISFMLLIGAGLMLRSLMALMEVEPGFRSENVLTMRIGLNMQGFGETMDDHRANHKIYMREVERRVGELPGVLSVAVANTFPMQRDQGFRPAIEIEDKPMSPDEVRPVTDFNFVSPGYFDTIGVPLLEGRGFEGSDTAESAGVAIITQAMARRYWPDQSPVGKNILVLQQDGWRRIVGVVGDIRQFGPESDFTDVIFVPSEQNGFPTRLLVRTAARPEEMIQTVSKTVLDVAPDQTLDSIVTLEQVRSDAVARPRLTTSLIGLFAGLALLITLAGIAGVLAVSVSQRTHEFGIRMALGARPVQVLGMVLRQGLTPVVLGLILGVLGALSLTHLVQSFLFRVEPTDPVTFFGVALVVIAAAAMASLIPARRATRVDPMIALRYE